MFTPKGMRRQHSRLGLSVNSPKTPLRSVANDSIISSPIGTPGRSNEATSVPIKVYELLKSGDKVSCGILPGGIGKFKFCFFWSLAIYLRIGHQQRYNNAMEVE